MKNFAIYVGTDGFIDIVEKDAKQDFLDFAYEKIGCEMIESVFCKRLGEDWCMIVDEEGLLGDSPRLNILGSYLYKMDKHKQPIVGNVLIMKEYDCDFQLVDEEEAVEKMHELLKMSDTAYYAIRKVCKEMGLM